MNNLKELGFWLSGFILAATFVCAVFLFRKGDCDQTNIFAGSEGYYWQVKRLKAELEVKSKIIEIEKQRNAVLKNESSR